MIPKVNLNIPDLFEPEITNGLRIYTDPCRKHSLPFVRFTSRTEDLLLQEIRSNIKSVDDVCPNIACQMTEQGTAFGKWAGFVLAEWDRQPEDIFTCGHLLKENSIFFGWISPNMVKYVRMPTEHHACFSDYGYDSFEMRVIAGDPAYLLGDKNFYYRTSSEPGERCALVLAEDGFAECGNSGNNIESLWIEFEGDKTRFPVIQNSIGKLPKQQPASRKWTVLDSMGRETLELFQYRTGWMIFIPPGVGIKMWVVPSKTGMIKPIPLGFGFCEDGFVRKYLDKRGDV